MFRDDESIKQFERTHERDVIVEQARRIGNERHQPPSSRGTVPKKSQKV